MDHSTALNGLAVWRDIDAKPDLSDGGDDDPTSWHPSRSMVATDGGASSEAACSALAVDRHCLMSLEWSNYSIVGE